MKSGLLIIITPLLLFFSACTTVAVSYHTQKESDLGVEYYRGILMVNDYEIPLVFNAVWADGVWYSLMRPGTPDIEMAAGFGNNSISTSLTFYKYRRAGYFKSAGTFRPDFDYSRRVPPESLQAGYYLGEKQLRDTPVSWIYVRWDEGAASIDPGRIKEVMAKKPFSEIRVKPLYVTDGLE